MKVKMPVSPHIHAFIAFFFFAMMSSCIKSLNGQVEVPLILCARFFVSFALVATITGSFGGLRDAMRTQSMKFHLIRATMAVIAAGCVFYVMPHVPLAEINVLGQTYPFILLILATYVLKEPVRKKQYLSCLLGFTGVLLIVRPSGDVSTFYAALVLLAALSNAMGDILVRWLTRKDDEVTIMLWFFLVSFLLSGVWCFFQVTDYDLTATEWEYIICAGILGGAAQYYLTKAYKNLRAGTMAAYSYLTLCLSVIFGWMIFAEIPTLWMVAGGLFIMAGVQWNYLTSDKALRSR